MHRVLVLSIALVAGRVLAVDAASFPGAVNQPRNRGDQVIFYYDAREGFTTFISLRNEGASELTASVLFYGSDVSAPFSQTLTLPFGTGANGAPGRGGLVLLDVGAFKANGLPAQAGIAIATGVDTTGQPIITRGLSGNFTVANLATGAAWGAPGAARSAVRATDANLDPCAERPPAPALGTVIDGTTVLLTPIQPTTASLSGYFNPETLAPVAQSGNQLIFINFEDVPGSVYRAKAGSTTWRVEATRATGVAVAANTFETTGVVVSDLVSVAGVGVNGASGAILLSTDTSGVPLTRLVFFTESLGTFGTGYLLPRR